MSAATSGLDRAAPDQEATGGALAAAFGRGAVCSIAASLSLARLAAGDPGAAGRLTAATNRLGTRRVERPAPPGVTGAARTGQVGAQEVVISCQSAQVTTSARSGRGGSGSMQRNSTECPSGSLQKTTAAGIQGKTTGASVSSPRKP